MNQNDIIGAAGVGLILIAYFCSTFGFMSSKSRAYFLLNVVGAGLACYASYLISYWPFVILEGTWTVVSLIGLVKAENGNK
jgi:hypothetical protein